MTPSNSPGWRPLARSIRSHRRSAEDAAGRQEGRQRPSNLGKRPDTATGAPLRHGLTAGGCRGDAGRAWTHFQGWKCVQAALSWKSQTQPDGLGSMARDMRGSGGSSVANLDSRNPQISSFFCPLCEEAGRAGEIGCALGSHCGATTNDQFRGFFGTCETVSPELSNPRVAGSSPAGRTRQHWDVTRPSV